MVRMILLSVYMVCLGRAGQEVVTKDGIRYLVWKAEAAKVRVVWKDENGKQLRELPAVKRYLEAVGEKPLMLMNGGIFEPGGVPSGVMIQNGHPLLPVNRKHGKGNFFLKPNGVFLIGDKGPAVMETGKFPPTGVEISFAVQSGPLLLNDGEVHPAFNSDSKSRLHRNGVGVTDSGSVVFAISDPKGRKFPNLHDFAELFRTLGCRNALFLDGDISQMRVGEAMGKPSNRFGSVIAVVE